MKFGLTAEQYQYLKTVVAEPLMALDLEIWCFGSRARGDHKEFSDVDLLLIGTNTKPEELSPIEERLVNENFPFKVDIVLAKELAPSYREGVEKDKVLFLSKKV